MTRCEMTRRNDTVRVPTSSSVLCVCLLVAGSICGPLRGELWTLPERLIDPQLTGLRSTIVKLHEKALRSKKPWSEDELREELPRKYAQLERRYADVKDPRQRAEALAQLALLYAELAWVERIEPLVEEVKDLDVAVAAKLGQFRSSDNFLARVVGADPKYLEAALRLAEAAREGYRELFGFEEISKVPGKRVRIVIHVDPELETDRLYFHPSPPYHSELRLLVPETKYLTLAGKRRLVYGFIHELGHMVAMWGEHNKVEDDRHAWAHYTGCLVVEEVYERLGNEPWPSWTAFQRRASGKTRLLAQIEGKESGTDSYESVLALFYRIGETWGTDVYGKAWTWLEKNRRIRRVNRVPYLWLRDLRDALAATVTREDAAKVAAMFGRS